MHQGPARRRLDADLDIPDPAKQVHGRTSASVLFFLLILAANAIDTNYHTVIGELGDSFRHCGGNLIMSSFFRENG